MEWTFQILKALQNIHGLKIIHRDLKPENILLHQNEKEKLEVRVADFGLSIQIESDLHLPTSFTGTPLYMAPELVKGNGYSYSVDIWSLGCIIYELYTFNNPFDAEELNKVLNNIVHENYKPLPITSDKRISKIVELCLNKQNRPSAEELLNIFFNRNKSIFYAILKISILIIG